MGNLPAEGGVNASLSLFYSRNAWIEGRAEDQLRQVAAWPGMRAVAAFPDLHPGRHGPVGAAFLADRIYPQLVGPDIGCGMALFRLDLSRHRLRLDKAARRLTVLDHGIDPAEAAAALAEANLAGLIGADGLGTIGGGNHFCELQQVTDLPDPETGARIGLAIGDLCLLVHTGSRGRGAAIFEGLDDSWKTGFDPDSPPGQAYLRLHDAAVAWAALNRHILATRVAEALSTGLHPICDAVHNHVERTGGLWLHRKGAARPDGGLAPLAGSRDALSYLLLAAGGPAEALGSLSHGAGRRYDRAAMHGRIAKSRSQLTALTRNRFGGQVICADRSLLIEEAGAAYKNPAAVVVDLQSFGLARPVASLMPLLTYKTGRSGGAE